MKKEKNWIGYCTNVHAGFDLEVTKQNLEKYAVAVKEQCAPSQQMGIGLWLSAQTAVEMEDSQQVDAFANWLQSHQLVPFTFNGFPFGNFHQEVVKHDVYYPTWNDDARLEYSQRLARILHRLLPDEMEGSISTLPLGWNGWKYQEPNPADYGNQTEFLKGCASKLIEMAQYLETLEEESGRLIYLCIEPEPGCMLETSQTCIDFYQNHLFNKSTQVTELVQRYLRVCHDTCHSAVMFEEQADFVRSLNEAGIKIGKVQVSSAVKVDLDQQDSSEAIQQLSKFNEPRYLHQTCLQTVSGEVQFYQDLQPALSELKKTPDQYQQARTHFHVPIFLKEFGALKTTQTEILQCLECTQEIDDLIHYEAETYAWNVLPESLQKTDLASGIAEEIRWLAGLG